MPLLAQTHLDIPTKDLISWCQDNHSTYDQNKAIYVDTATGDTISANQAYKYIRQLVAGFRAAGLKRGDCVCIHSFNNLYYPILVQGIVAAGGVFVGTNPSYTAYELEHAIKTSKARYMIAEPDLLDAPKKVARQLGLTDDRILLLSDDANSQHATWRSLLRHGEQDWVRFNDLETAKNTTAFLMFSSGTTGLPKAAQLSHYNLVAEHTLVHENPHHPSPFPVSMPCPLPLFHAAMAPYVHTSALRSGLTAYIMRRFEPSAYLAAIKKYSITRLMMVPPMVIAVLNLSHTEPARVRASLASVRSVVAGAAPSDAATQNKLATFLPQSAAFTQLWAMTETSCIATYFYPPKSDSSGSVGRLMPDMDCKLIDSDGKEIGPYDVQGELCVRGPTVIRGYLDNPKANTESWDDEGYFHTGDIAVLSSKNDLWYIVDRNKELIKVRGFQVSPAEVEGVLLSHPSIKEAAVFGIVVGGKGEVPRAHIIKREGIELSEEEVKDWIKDKLARYK
ncbi:Phenylacetyl-CoA ligase epaB [Pseudocercospora fuligena]|uniref:Phenylacetyl-CoA ligase epaB n=1 Tax=Pseudocercospora fuligena TaxID=685502 RepID=A0A8H6RAJ6_9PEZI|nr:Phenylacetyl-CoA ligase epaB [Pseudocercospora fuligena]